MPGPIEHIGPLGPAHDTVRPKANRPVTGDFAAALRQASGQALGAAPLALPSSLPVDLATTVERMERVTAHLRQARAYFQPLLESTPQVEAEA